MLSKELSAISGSKYVSEDDFILFSYSRDSGPFPKRKPGVVVRPGSEEEIVEIVRLANRDLIPIIPRGGGASLFGLPINIPGRSIILDVTRLNRVIEINDKNMTVTTQCGITTSELGTVLEKNGYYANLMLMPYYTDTLGGALSGVNGGGWPLDFPSAGTNWLNIMGLKVILPDGDIIYTGGSPGTNVHTNRIFERSAGSPDITGLFIGDGGIFGIKIEATLRIFPNFKIIKGGSFLFDSFDNLWESMSRLMSIEPIPYNFAIGFEPDTTALMSQGEDNKWSFLYSVRGYDDSNVNRRVETIERICKECKGKKGSKKLDENVSIDGGRNILSDMGKYVSLGLWVFMESFISKERFAEHYKKCNEFIEKRWNEERLKERGAIRHNMILPYLHNLAFCGTNISYPDLDRELREKILKIAKDYYNFAVKQGGFLWAHQGYGAEVMASNWSPSFYTFVKRLKKAIDPNNIINPGLWRL